MLKGNIYGLAALAGAPMEMAVRSHEPMVLPYSELPDAISARALENHFQLYTGYIETLGSIWNRLEGEMRPVSHDHASPYRALKLEEPYAYNGVILHELYFGGLAPLTVEDQEAWPGTAFRDRLNQEFGSVEEWWAEMCATGNAADGWALTAFDRSSGQLCVVAATSNHIGIPVNKTILVAVDVFEHAFWMDHGIDRTTYLDRLYGYLNWPELERRFVETC